MAEKKYGISDIAKVLKVKPATARIYMRLAKVKKGSKAYEWPNETAMKKEAQRIEKVLTA